METLQSLCDLANGKPRRWESVSLKATDLFKRWIADWHAAQTLEEVLDEWEMGHVLDKYLETRAVCVRKHVQVETVRPRAPWDDNHPGPYRTNDELLYLILALVTLPRCERLRKCRRCPKYFVAPRLSQKYCRGECGRLEASKLAAKDKAAVMLRTRLEACRIVYAKYKRLKVKHISDVKYVLTEANRNLDDAYKLGGTKGTVNFVTRHREEIGIPRRAK